MDFLKYLCTLNKPYSNLFCPKQRLIFQIWSLLKNLYYWPLYRIFNSPIPLYNSLTVVGYVWEQEVCHRKHVWYFFKLCSFSYSYSSCVILTLTILFFTILKFLSISHIFFLPCLFIVIRFGTEDSNIMYSLHCLFHRECVLIWNSLDKEIKGTVSACML